MANEFNVKRVAKATYDFDVHGGATGAIGLGVFVPAGAIIQRCTGNVLDTLASDGSATVAIAAGTDVLNAATAFNHADMVGVDVHLADATPVVAAGGEITWTIAVAALTAGKYDIFVEYVY